MEYNNEVFKNIDTGCPAAANIGLGAIIDTAYNQLKTTKKYTGDVLTDAQVSALDKMCSASDITDVAYILNSILTASKSQGTVDELSAEMIDKIDNGFCGVFQSCQLGTKLEEMIEIVNDSSDDTVADFKTFKIGDYVGTVDTTNATVAISVPYGTDVSAAVAEFTFVNSKSTAKVGSTAQESGVTTNDFSSPVTYIITAEDGTTTKNYVVTVTELANTEAKITAYSLASVDGVIDETNHTIAVEVPKDTDVTALAATFTLSAQATAKIGDDAQTSGTTENDFTNPVTYIITAGDEETTQNYVVTVTVAE